MGRGLFIAALALPLSTLLAGCKGSLCCGMFADVADADTGEPVADAEMEWVATNSSKLGSKSYEQYLNDHGRPIGRTTEHGGFLLPVCGQSEPLDFVNSIFTTVNDLILLRFTYGDRSEIVVLHTEKEFRGQGLPGILSVESEGIALDVYGHICSSDSSIDQLLPPSRRTGNSSVWLGIRQRPPVAAPPSEDEAGLPNEPPADAVIGAPVTFATASAAELAERTPDQILDDSGKSVGKTDEFGQVVVQVFTDAAAYETCDAGTVAERWIVRVEIDGQPHTVVLKPADELPPARFYEFRSSRPYESEDGSIAIQMTGEDCLNACARNPITCRSRDAMGAGK